MFRNDFVLWLRGIKTVTICLLLMMVMGTVAARAQKVSLTPWHYPGSGYENGKLSELKDKYRVYVSYFDLPAFPQDLGRTGLRQRILNQLSKHNTLEIVESPEAAELAVHINSSMTGSWDFYVLTRGELQKDGKHKARVVVKKLRSDSKDSTMVIEQAVSTFVDDLRTVRGQK